MPGPTKETDEAVDGKKGQKEDEVVETRTKATAKKLSCKDKRCDFGSVCIESTLSPQCVCPENCDQYLTANERQLMNEMNANMGGGKPAVCGSDGNDYVNECELRRTMCLKRRTLTVKFIGKCGKL